MEIFANISISCFEGISKYVKVFKEDLYLLPFLDEVSLFISGILSFIIFNISSKFLPVSLKQAQS